MAYKVGTGTSLKKTDLEEISPADFLLLSFQSVVYDPYKTADLSQNGIGITASGLYLFFYNGVLGTTASTGHASIQPTSTGPTSFEGARAVDIPPAITMNVNEAWCMYLNVTTPDVIVMEVDNNTDASLDASIGVMTLVKLG